MSKRTSKADVDSATISKLKKYLSSLDPEKVEKRKKYAQKPQVKSRRKELNAERRLLWNVLTKMVVDGYMYDKDGNQFAIYVNRVITDNNSKFYFMDNERKIESTSYTDYIDLLSKEYKTPTLAKKDKLFQEYLSKFIEGDPIVIDKVSKKRVYTESEDPSIQHIREILREQTKGLSDDE